MYNEVSETFTFNPHNYTVEGKNKSTGQSFRDYVKECEVYFHRKRMEYHAGRFYSNGDTMRLLQSSCGAAPFLAYGMEIYSGESFDGAKDPFINMRIDLAGGKTYTVYAINSAYMKTNEDGAVIVDDDDVNIGLLTLLIDNNMPPYTFVLFGYKDDSDDDDDDIEIVDAPQAITQLV